jgi:hypothetical protein
MKDRQELIRGNSRIAKKLAYKSIFYLQTLNVNYSAKNVNYKMFVVIKFIVAGTVSYNNDLLLIFT